MHQKTDIAYVMISPFIEDQSPTSKMLFTQYGNYNVVVEFQINSAQWLLPFLGVLVSFIKKALCRNIRKLPIYLKSKIY